MFSGGLYARLLPGWPAQPESMLRARSSCGKCSSTTFSGCAAKASRSAAVSTGPHQWLPAHGCAACTPTTASRRTASCYPSRDLRTSLGLLPGLQCHHAHRLRCITPRHLLQQGVSPPHSGFRCAQAMPRGASMDACCCRMGCTWPARAALRAWPAVALALMLRSERCSGRTGMPACSRAHPLEHSHVVALPLLGQPVTQGIRDLPASAGRAPHHQT